MKNVLFEQKIIKLQNKLCFVETITEIMQHVLKFYLHSHMWMQVI
jgi:hypothetical protein